MFYSLTKLSAPVQQVLYQMKVVTTAGRNWRVASLRPMTLSAKSAKPSKPSAPLALLRRVLSGTL